MKIVVGTTMTGFAAARHETSLRWLDTAEKLTERTDLTLLFYAALEVDNRAIRPFLDGGVLHRLTDLDGTYGTYQLGGPVFNREQVTSGNRYTHICTGRNLVAEHARGHNADYVLYLDADMRPPAGAIDRLLEMRHPLVGGNVPTYCLSGHRVVGRRACDHGHTPRQHDQMRASQLAAAGCAAEPYPKEWDVRAHMNTAGFLLAHRNVYSRLTWRWDGQAGMTDDPCYHRDAIDLLGVDTHVRHDLVGSHWPEAIPPLEERGYDLRIH
jgi:hypothetical protein